MKHYHILMSILSCMLFLPATPADDCLYERGESRTFLYTHPAYANLPIRQSLWHTFINDLDNEHKAVWQIITVGAQSFSQSKTARYFLFGCKQELLIAGDQSPDAFIRDVRAEWLGINNPKFSGILTLSPRQEQIGIILDYNLSFAQFECAHWLKDYWLTIEIPIFSVKNNMGITQQGVINQGTQFPHDIIEAFNQPEWRYAKIKPTSTTTIGACDISMRLGKTYLSEKGNEVSFYSGFSIPAGPQQNAEYLFDSYLGNNGHFGILSGVNFQIRLNRDPSCYEICWFLDLEALFLIHNTQSRTFDLVGKPWSRYLLFNKKNGTPNDNIPGVNILTHPVTVRPFDIVDFATGIRVIGDYFEIEMGYGIWGHSDEWVNLDKHCPFPLDFGIAGVSPNIISSSPPCPTTLNTANSCAGGVFTGIAIPGPNNTVIACNTTCTAATANRSTIRRIANTDTDQDGNPIFVPLCKGDLDFRSAAAKKSINHRFHVSCGYKRSDEQQCVMGFVGIGAFYEFGYHRKSLQSGGIWLKAGASY